MFTKQIRITGNDNLVRLFLVTVILFGVPNLQAIPLFCAVQKDLALRSTAERVDFFLTLTSSITNFAVSLCFRKHYNVASVKLIVILLLGYFMDTWLTDFWKTENISY